MDGDVYEDEIDTLVTKMSHLTSNKLQSKCKFIEHVNASNSNRHIDNDVEKRGINTKNNNIIIDRTHTKTATFGVPHGKFTNNKITSTIKYTTNNLTFNNNSNSNKNTHNKYNHHIENDDNPSISDVSSLDGIYKNMSMDVIHDSMNDVSNDEDRIYDDINMQHYEDSSSLYDDNIELKDDPSFIRHLMFQNIRFY